MNELQFAGNGERVTDNGHGLMVDEHGYYGYNQHLSGAYVCYTCGHLCEEETHELALEGMGV